MEYRVYIDGNFGPERIGGNLSYSEMLEMLDILIIDEKRDKVLVIEHNIELDSDFPAFLYTGNIKKYCEFKEKQENCNKKLTISKKSI